MNKKYAILKNKSISAFVASQVLYTGIASVVGIFINTFLLKFFGDNSTNVLFYNLVSALVQPFAMLLAIAISNKGNGVTVQRIGFVFYGIACVFLAIFGEKVAPYYLLFAVIMSFGAGFYFTPYACQMVSYMQDESRDFVSGIITFTATIICIILPLISGYLMSSLGFLGYQIMFGVVALMALCALVSSIWLAPLRKTELQRQTSFITVLKTILKSKEGLKNMIASGIDNCRTHTITFYLPVLMYMAIKNEMFISVTSVAGSIASVLSALLYAVMIIPKNRIKAVFIAILVNSIASLPMIFYFAPISIMIFSVARSFCNIFIATPILNSYLAYIDSMPSLKGMEAEVHTVRELFVTSGRVLGIAIIFIIPQTIYGMVATLVILTASCFISGWLVKDTKVAKIDG